MPKNKHKTFFITAKADILYECLATSKKDAARKFEELCMSSVDLSEMLSNDQNVFIDIKQVETADEHLKRDCWP